MADIVAENEIARLERQLRLMWVGVLALSVVVLSTAGAGVYFLERFAHPQTLTLRQLTIVDEHGTPRAILGSPAPPPMHVGRAGKRDGPVSGLLILDATGSERGGYVTSDGQDGNALFTLDSQLRQTVLLLAEKNGPTLFRIWNQDHGSLVMGVSEDAPFLNVRRGENVFFSRPENNPQTRDSRFLFR